MFVNLSSSQFAKVSICAKCILPGCIDSALGVFTLALLKTARSLKTKIVFARINVHNNSSWFDDDSCLLKQNCPSNRFVAIIELKLKMISLHIII